MEGMEGGATEDVEMQEEADGAKKTDGDDDEENEEEKLKRGMEDNGDVGGEVRTEVKNLADDFRHDGTDGTGLDGTQQDRNMSSMGIKEKSEEGKHEGRGEKQGDQGLLGGRSVEPDRFAAKDATVLMEKEAGGMTMTDIMGEGGTNGVNRKAVEGTKKLKGMGDGRKLGWMVMTQKKQVEVVQVEDANDDDEDDAASDKTPPKDNGVVGRDSARIGRMSFQAMERVDLPVFRDICPRRYLYRYDLKLQVPA
jgi:hypothetical protein